MIIKTLWYWRRSEDVPELLEAWDEYSIDQNFEGWQDACKSALDSLRGESGSDRYIDIRVDTKEIERIFDVDEIEGKATPG